MKSVSSYVYELDYSRALGDGRPSPSKWITELNGKLCEGKRILLLDYGFDKRHDFVRYYKSEYTTPNLPNSGIYVLYNNPNYVEGRDWGPKKHVIKYLPDDFWNPRKIKESIEIDIERGGLLNYDDASLEDVEYYLNSRLHRSQYFKFVKQMKMFKRQYLEDKKEEDDYVRMMVGQIMTKGYVPKEGFTLQGVVREAIETVKGRLKWKRPITAKEKETYTLVSRTLFSKKFVAKYFL